MELHPNVHMVPIALRGIQTMVEIWYTSHSENICLLRGEKEGFGYLKNPSPD